MSVLAAVERILREAGGALHYREITRLVLERGLWKTQGKTPEATVNARLATDIKRKGDGSAFVRTGPGLFDLRERAGLIEGRSAGGDGGKRKAKKKRAGKTLSFTAAAEHVLTRYAGKKPMHYREITERALSLNLLQTQGKTPEATMYAQVLTETQRKKKRGEVPRFVQHGRGFVGLSRWMGRGLEFEVEQHNARVRKQLLADLKKAPFEAFEELVSQLLVAIGFEDVNVTQARGDGGIDVRGTLVVGDVIRTRMAVQAKRWKGNVQAPVVQQVRGSLGTHEQGLIVTTSDFSPGARREAERADAVPVGLMDGEQLARLLAEHEIGVRRTDLQLLERDEVE